jgi:hypothetical protein
MLMRLRPLRQHSRLALVASFALVLLLAQTLGPLHRVVHPHTETGYLTHIDGNHGVPASAAVEESAIDEGGGILSLLFASHQSDSDCRSYDQLCYFDAIADFVAPALALALQTFVLVLLAGLATARWHALFQARGPPFPR